MTQTVSTERDTQIDVFRALALLTIYINHVPGTAFEHLTYKNFGFSDAAEAFVLLSGMSVALAYGTKFQPGNRLLATLKMWRRAGVLYVAHIVMTMAAIAIFCGAAVFTKRPDLLTQINIEPLIRASTPGADWHRRAWPSARLQQHSAGLCGAAFDVARSAAARQLQAMAGARCPARYG